MPKKAISIRFDEEKFELAKKETGQPTVQKLVNFILDSIWAKHHSHKIEFKSSLSSIKDISTDDGKVIGELNGLTGKYTPTDSVKAQLEDMVTGVAPKGLHEKSNQTKILELEEELKSLGNSSVAAMRKKFLQKQIKLLKK